MSGLTPGAQVGFRVVRSLRGILILVALAAVGLASAPAASAWVTVGNCRLHAYVPSWSSSGVATGKALIDTCPDSSQRLNLEACMQVRTPSGGAATKSESCRTHGYATAGSLVEFSYTIDWSFGHTYRTWAWASVNGVQGTYTSSWVTF